MAAGRTLSHAELNEVILGLSALELKAVALYREHRRGVDAPPEALAEATGQLLKYNAACVEVAKAVRSLDAVPAGEDDLVGGYPL